MMERRKEFWERESEIMRVGSATMTATTQELVRYIELIKTS